MIVSAVSDSPESNGASTQRNGELQDPHGSYNDVLAIIPTETEIANNNEELDNSVTIPSNRLLPSDVIARLEVHARMSEQAGLFEFEALKVEALTGYKMDIQYAWSHSEFPSLLNLAHSLPVPDIPGMSIRSYTAALFADHIEFLMHRDEFKEVIMTIPNLGRDVLEAETSLKPRSKQKNDRARSNQSC